MRHCSPSGSNLRSKLLCNIRGTSRIPTGCAGRAPDRDACFATDKGCSSFVDLHAMSMWLPSPRRAMLDCTVASPWSLVQLRPPALPDSAQRAGVLASTAPCAESSASTFASSTSALSVRLNSP